VPPSEAIDVVSNDKPAGDEADNPEEVGTKLLSKKEKEKLKKEREKVGS
jgi:hypothetical protein